MLSGSKEPQEEPLSPLAEFLMGDPVPGEEPHRLKVLRDAKERIARLLAFAETQPESWRLLIQFIGEEVRQHCDRAADVNPRDDPAKIHGYQCFEAGGAKALTALARKLLPGELKKTLDKLTRLCDTSERNHGPNRQS